MPAVVPMVMPRAIPADPVRPVIGPDHPTVAVRIAVIGGIVGRSVEAPEVSPVSEVRPVVGVAIAAIVKCAIAAIATTAEHRSGAKTTAVKSTTVETAATTMEATASAVETAAAMTATTAVTEANPDHRSIGRDFR